MYYKHIYTFIDIIDTCGKSDLKKHILEKCTITKQHGKSKSIFYEPCFKTRQMCFSENKIYYPWSDQVKNAKLQDKKKKFKVKSKPNDGISETNTQIRPDINIDIDNDGISETNTEITDDGISETNTEITPDRNSVVDEVLPVPNPVSPPLPPKENLTSKEFVDFIKSKVIEGQISLTIDEWYKFMDRFNELKVELPKKL